MELKLNIDITPDMYKTIENAYAYYNLNVNDVVEILLKQSYILGDCPFYPEVVDVTIPLTDENRGADIAEIDWRDPEAVRQFMEEE